MVTSLLWKTETTRATQNEATITMPSMHLCASPHPACVIHYQAAYHAASLCRVRGVAHTRPNNEPQEPKQEDKPVVNPSLCTKKVSSPPRNLSYCHCLHCDKTEVTQCSIWTKRMKKAQFNPYYMMSARKKVEHEAKQSTTRTETWKRRHMQMSWSAKDLPIQLVAWQRFPQHGTAHHTHYLRQRQGQLWDILAITGHQ